MRRVFTRTFAPSLLFAIILLMALHGSTSAQTVTQETYDRLKMPAIKGIIYGAIDAAASFLELGDDINLINNKGWQERWYNVGFLIGWHGETLTKIDDKGDPFMIGIKRAAQGIMDGYDAVDLGINALDTVQIQAGTRAMREGMATLLLAYGVLYPESLGEIKLYQSTKLAGTAPVAQVATQAPAPTPTQTPIPATIVISGTVGTVNKSANLRGGPGTAYAVVGSAKAGDTVAIVGTNADGSWLKLAENKWIAAFLVTQGEASPVSTATLGAPTAVSTTLPTAVSTAVPTAAQTSKLTYWGDAGVQTCGNFEWSISNVRRAKDTWYYSRNQVAQGEYLIVYVEAKNISGGTASFWEIKPSMPGKEIAERASQYAAWMMTGGFNTLWKDDVAPSEFITLVGAFDVAPGIHTYLFGALSCGQTVTIGSWFELERGAIKANN